MSHYKIPDGILVEGIIGGVQIPEVRSEMHTGEGVEQVRCIHKVF